MEALFPSSFLSSSDWFVDATSQGTIWTKEENKAFESALAIYAEDMPDRWIRVAQMIPGKTVWDVIKQYRELEDDICDIEAGKVPIPGYLTSSFTLGRLIGGRDFDAACRKRPSGSKPNSDQERKKGVPWTEDEHRRFLLGLLKYGKGDWRNISRNFVVSKTPTQVASHAQKYYQRQQSGGKDKRRPSIHDITTYNVSAATSSLSQSMKLLEQSDHAISLPQTLLSTLPKTGIDHWPTDGLFAVFASTNVNRSLPSSYDAASNGLKFQDQNLYASAYCDIPLQPHSSVF